MNKEGNTEALTVPFSSQAEWEKWLDAHTALEEGVWLKIAKKATGIPTVTYAEALDVALCYGWIDGQKRTFDKSYYLQKFTPRRARSIWSKVNVDKVTTLIAEGRMQPGGMAAIEAAKKDGRWDQAYDSPSKSQMPEDFKQALEKNSAAKEFYATLNKTNTYAFLWRIQTAKKPETRRVRIEKFVAMLEKGEKLH